MSRHSRAAAGLAALLGISLCVGLAVAGPTPQKSIHDGVFTADQVQAGEEVFDDICLECHTNDVFGPDYMLGWSGASVGEFYEQLEGTMPYESPGTLDDDQYTNVIVYLFAINGVAPGDSEMPTDLEQLREISIDGPFSWNGREH
jgi:mono/diheme cytochrome c family protein